MNLHGLKIFIEMLSQAQILLKLFTHFPNKMKSLILPSPDTTILPVDIWPDMSEEQIYNYLIENKVNLFFPTDTLENSNKSFQKMFLYNTKDLVINSIEWNKNLYRHEKRRGDFLSETKFSQACSNHFFEDLRLKENHRLTDESPLNAYNTPESCIRVLRHLKKNHQGEQPITSRTLRRYLISIFPEKPQFPPLVAKHIINRFCPKNGHVLDINCEWGDRLAGFYASDAEIYTGIFNSPSKEIDVVEVVDRYVDFVDNLAQISRDDKDVNLSFNQEKVRFSYARRPKKPNLIFTSLNSLKSIPETVYNLLDPSILQKKGYIVVHLDDFKNSSRKRVRIIEELYKKMNRHRELTRISPMGFEMSRSLSTWGEPLWIWRKN